MFDIKKISLVISILVLTSNYLTSEEKYEYIPERVYAGEIHYSRIPVEYWQHRIQMVKALGMNVLSVYVMWNFHEVEKGVFDYQTGNKNLSLFLDLAQKYEMKVLFRPGPYVCAEWDFGGLPARLLAVKGLTIRSNNELFLEEVSTYFKSLVGIVKKHQQTVNNPSGSIIMVQIENEYGFYGTDKSYIEDLRKLWKYLLINPPPQYYVDWIENILKCHWSGANIGINNGISQDQFDYVREIETVGFIFGGQIYSGWLTHWYEQWQQKSISKNQEQFGFLLSNNHSFSMYMVHGGTNFALTAGANGFIGEKYDYRAHVTSYDYDAPINEQGRSTKKYQALKQLIKPYIKWNPYPEPSPIPTMKISQFAPIPMGSMLENLGTPVLTGQSQLIPFESEQLKMFNQGFVAYQTTLPAQQYSFTCTVHDYALIYLDSTYIGNLDRSVFTSQNFTVNCQRESCTLLIIVEATGHINFDHSMETDYKGLIKISDEKNTQFLWNYYTLPINEQILNWKGSNYKDQPTLLRAKINLSDQQLGDTYLDMSQFSKGYVWVNNNNLGRFWNVGPQTRLFCPATYLSNSTTIHVLQLHYDSKIKYISGEETLTP